MKRPHILITNDDGIHAPGIEKLWKVLYEADIADLSIIAPSKERSGTGASITWDRPMLVQEISWFQNTPAWSVDGTPTDCVKMGTHIILKQKPDFIISGINAGSNAGRNVLHSGTVGAVIEGTLKGISGLALSCENGDEPNFHVAQKYVVDLVHYLLAHPLAPGCFLNVNFPHCVQDKVKGFRLTRQGKGRWSENPHLHVETKHGASYWLGGEIEKSTQEDADCDTALLKQGYMTAVPIHVHELTDQKELNAKQKHFEDFLHSKSPV